MGTSYGEIVIVLYIILIGVFLLSLVTLVKGSSIIKYRVIDIPPENLEEETIDYNKLKHKYDIKNCNQVCKRKLCDNYHVQNIKYDLCKECKKEGKCYDPNEGICKFCLDFRSCETLYGCNNKAPIDPTYNNCQECWL